MGPSSSKGRRGSASRVCSPPLAPRRRPTCASCRREGASWSASCPSESSGSCWSQWLATDAEEQEALLAGAAALAKPVLSESDPETGDEASFSALHGLYWLTVNLAGSQPVLVTVDDAHCADVASLRWLIYLARRLAGVPLALVLATRPAEPGPMQELHDELLVIPEVTVLEPGGLSEQAITMLAAQSLAADPDAEFVTACQRATGGNPFLLLELFGELARRGIVPSRENAGLASQLNSQGVGRSVRARLRRLPSGCIALARAVAVLGDGAEPILAAQLADLDDDEAARAADALSEAAILEPGRPLAFVHTLVRSNVYSEMSSRERARSHERAARLLADAGEAPDRIAIHLLATHPGGNAETVNTLRRAAKGARNRGAPDVAVTYLQRALAEPPSADQEPKLVYELGTAALSAGELEMAIEKLRQATRDLADGRLRAEAANALGSALFLAQRPEEAMTDLTTVIDELPASEREQGLRLQATRWAAARGSVAVWQRLKATGERFVVESRTPRTIGERLQVAAAAYEAARTGTAAEARELALQALADGRLLEDPGPESGGFWIAPFVLVLAHADDDQARVTTEVIEWAKQHGSLPVFSMATQLRAYAYLRSGSLADAEADATSALEQPAVPGLFPFGRIALVNVLLARGKATEACDVFEQIRPEPAAPGYFRYLLTRARLRAALQHPEDALEDLFECGRLEEAWEVRTPAFGSWRADAAPLLASLGRQDEARALRARSSSAAAPSAHRGRSAFRCARLASSNRERPGSSCSSNRSLSSSGRRGGSSSPSRCSSSGRRPAASDGAPTRASRSAKRSSSPVPAVPTRSLYAPTTSSSQRVRARAETRPRVAAPSLPLSCASLVWPPTV